MKHKMLITRGPPLLAVALAVGVSLAACGSPAHHTQAVSPAAAAKPAATQHLTGTLCQQVAEWRAGPVKAPSQRMYTDLQHQVLVDIAGSNDPTAGNLMVSDANAVLAAPAPPVGSTQWTQGIKLVHQAGVTLQNGGGSTSALEAATSTLNDSAQPDINAAYQALSVCGTTTAPMLGASGAPVATTPADTAPATQPAQAPAAPAHPRPPRHPQRPPRRC